MSRHSKQRGLLFIISGPSGSGKTTLARQLLDSKTLKDKLARSISFTTRPKRSGEQDKTDYFFISGNQFRREVQAGQILEWTKYLGHYYGTPKGFVEKQLNKARHVILCLDHKGACAVRQQYRDNAVTIFVMPPSIDALLERITGRCDGTKKEEVRRRLKLARQELSSAGKYDYCVVNKDLKQAAKKLQNIILTEISSLKQDKKEEGGVICRIR